MKKRLITKFFEKNPTKRFSKQPDPYKAAYDNFIMKNPEVEVSLSYFTKIFNEVHLSVLPDKIDYKNVSEVISAYPRKHIHGFTSTEIDLLLKKYKISRTKFNEEMGVNTAMLIDGEIVSFDTDIELSLRVLLGGRKRNVFEFD